MGRGEFRMIHNAKIEITCEKCANFLEYEMPWVYDDYSGNNGHYTANDSDIEALLKSEGWIIKGDKHFCEYCADRAD